MNLILTEWLPKTMIIGLILSQVGCSLIGLELQSQPASPGAKATAEPAQVSNYRQNLNNAIKSGQDHQQQAIDQVEKQ